MRTNFIIPLYLFLFLPAFMACQKDRLQTPPSSGYAVLNTLEDCQQLLDNEVLFSQTPAALIESADEVYVTDFFYGMMELLDQRMYRWDREIYDDRTVPDWNFSYEQVFYANLVLEKLTELATDRPLHGTVKGTALFLRASAFYHLAQLYVPPFDSSRLMTPLGIPLRVVPDVNAPTVRSTVGATYARILEDLQDAVASLPPGMDRQHLNRPSRAAAWALLARVYMSMRLYAQAMAAADAALRLYPTLIDYNTLDSSTNYPFTANNSETLYQSHIRSNSFVEFGFAAGMAGVDTTLYRLYDAGDLRRLIFWDSLFPAMAVPKASYYGEKMLFTGLATNELYLIRAECAARQNQVERALEDLNTLLAHRWKPLTFVPLATTDAVQALRWILVERQKELVLRGQRWTDLRRLNLEAGHSTSLTRLCGGQTWVLPPNDARYTLPLPPKVVKDNQLQQNPR